MISNRSIVATRLFFALPTSFAPYLEEFAERLKHRYKLTFEAKSGKKADFENVKLETCAPNAQLVGANEVYVP